jgi:hypothetical protein
VNPDGNRGRERFLAESMLGRLAKWLRIFGYDTHYERAYAKGAVEILLRSEDRILLTRCWETLKRQGGGVFIRSDHIQEQLRQLIEERDLRLDPNASFQRCPVCNERLRVADLDSVRDRVPEYVLFQHGPCLRLCPCCGRIFWRGTHPDRMRAQLKAWGILFELGSGRMQGVE